MAGGLWDEAYRGGRVPWDIGRPQPAIGEAHPDPRSVAAEDYASGPAQARKLFGIAFFTGHRAGVMQIG